MSSATIEPRTLGKIANPPIAWGVGDESLTVAAHVRETISLNSVSISRQTLRQAFRDLAETWRQDTVLTSSAVKMATHPAYLRIIGFGQPAIPLILEELEQRPGHWFLALAALTGVDPVRPEQRGRLHEMVNAWLDWGSRNGYR